MYSKTLYNIKLTEKYTSCQRGNLEVFLIDYVLTHPLVKCKFVASDIKGGQYAVVYN